MNIFKVLNQGKSRLHEPSVSAMLGYLLNTHKDHGLGDSFLRAFLKLVNKQIDSKKVQQILDKQFINTEISLEEPYQLNGYRKDIDIQISILDRNNNKEDQRIIIENKIKTGSANTLQLLEYYKAILEDDNTIENLIIVFLTPKSNNQSLIEEYEALTVRDGHHKVWLYWNNDENGGLLNIIKSILKSELYGEINPINEYMKHTLKAFTIYMNSTVDQSNSHGIRLGEDIGDIIEDVEITLSDKKLYKIVRRNSQQIQVYTGEEKIVAKPILRRIIEEKGFDIPLHGITTRMMGKKVVDAMNASLN